MQYKMSKIYTLLVLFLGVSLTSMGISIEREIFPKELRPGESVIVSITVKKEGEEGFAKLMETLPDDFVAEELNSATGNFIFEDGKLRIIWLTMPEGNSFRAEYKLIYNGTKSGYFKLWGKFYYVKNGKRSEHALKSSSVHVLKTAAPEVAKVLPKITTKAIERDTTAEEVEEPKEEVAEPKEEVKVEEPEEEVKVEEPKEEVKEEPKEEVKVEEPKEEVKEEPKEEVKVEEPVEEIKSEVVFKVQLGVFSTEKSMSVFGDLPEVHHIMVGKLFKYYSGNFSSEFEARSVIEKARANGFPGAFLVRFKDGKRI